MSQGFAIVVEPKPAIEKIKYRYFRYKSGTPHNNFLGTHGQNPRACMACVSVVVASMEYEGKTYFGVAFRNDKDQVNRKIGKLIAHGRLMKNLGESWSISTDAFRDAVRDTYESGPYFNIKHYWQQLVVVTGCY